MGNVLRNLDFSRVTDILISVIPALICITFHEVSHGFVALRLGDTTAKSMGRITANPIKHIDPFGLIMMVLVGFGWAKPVPVDMRNFKNPKRGMAITALAGPVSNILLAIVVLLIFWLLFTPLGGFYAVGAAGTVLATLYRTAQLSVALAVFNLIPIPPLDGSKVLFSLATDETYYKLMRYERYGMLVLIVILMWSNYSGSNVFNETIGTAVSFLFNRLSSIAHIVRL